MLDLVIKNVRLNPRVEKDIAVGRVPVQVARRLQTWVDDVEARGLAEVRKVPGYHDEPLHGDRRGQRSIRLNKQWRAIYEMRGATAVYVWVEEVTPHKY